MAYKALKLNERISEYGDVYEDICGNRFVYVKNDIDNTAFGYKRLKSLKTMVHEYKINRMFQDRYTFTGENVAQQLDAFFDIFKGVKGGYR